MAAPAHSAKGLKNLLPPNNPLIALMDVIRDEGANVFFCFDLTILKSLFLSNGQPLDRCQ